MATYPTPYPSEYPKNTLGVSDASIINNMLTFMGCPVVNCSMTIGLNGTASSLSVTLVEDTINSLFFSEPDIPSIYAFSLPPGGVGQPIIHSYYPFSSSDTFYFAGICTSFSRQISDIGGKTITVDIVDPRDVLTGVQCLLGGFALSQNITADTRYSGINNVIDVFGYYDFGMSADRNEYGLAWSNIYTCLNNVRVWLHEMWMEFEFVGEAFINAPNWYRIDAQTIDILSLVQKVANDSGSDLMVTAKKINDPVGSGLIVQFKAIRRSNTDLLTKGELAAFVSNRSSIIKSARIGKEYRNEPTSSIIIGGYLNKNYVALPSEYVPELKLRKDGFKVTYNASVNVMGWSFGLLSSAIFRYDEVDDKNAFVSRMNELNFSPTVQSNYETEDRDLFIEDIKSRIFFHKRGDGTNANCGAIFPWWGYADKGKNYPLAEPFLALDHLVLDKLSNYEGNLETLIPLCNITTARIMVREVDHKEVFLPGDDDSDTRPFAYVSEYKFSNQSEEGWTRGLPLNTDILQVAIHGDYDLFKAIYAINYPDIAERLGWDLIDWIPLLNSNQDNINIIDFINHGTNTNAFIELVMDPNGIIKKNSSEVQQLWINQSIRTRMMDRFGQVIFEQVRAYADENIGRKWLVALPKSYIMNRIWDDLDVPTRKDFPEIEYIVDNRAYWTALPNELGGYQNFGEDWSFDDEESDQILERFSVEDGRFLPMVAMDWQPIGNIGFWSNMKNKAMFQDLPPSDFRPNHIADGNPSYVFIASSVRQLDRRPDMAIVSIPSPVYFDPLDGMNKKTRQPQNKYRYEESMFNNLNFYEYIHRSIEAKAPGGVTVSKETKNKYARQLYAHFHNDYTSAMQIERVMDLKGCFIPLTSTWKSYGPWFKSSENAPGMVDIVVDPSLVPWNFDRPTSTDPDDWDENLNAAGEERLERTLSVVDYVDNGVITAAGYPEFGPADTSYGYNANLAGISVTFGVEEVLTTYTFATYAYKPGTYRKSEYDNVSRARRDTRDEYKTPINENILHSADIEQGTNRFKTRDSLWPRK